MKKLLAGCVCLGTLASACAGAPSDREDARESLSAVALQLTTEAPSGNRYRLGPASFTIVRTSSPGDAALVQVTGAEPALTVPVDVGTYSVTLEPGWTLNRIGPDGGLVPELATVLQNEQWVSVAEFRTTAVTFPFHLGQTGLSIGIDVEEGVPPGYDGRITSHSDGVDISYGVEFADGGGACCFATVEAARAAYPGSNLFWPMNPTP